MADRKTRQANPENRGRSRDDVTSMKPSDEAFAGRTEKTGMRRWTTLKASRIMMSPDDTERSDLGISVRAPSLGSFLP